MRVDVNEKVAPGVEIAHRGERRGSQRNYCSVKVKVTGRSTNFSLPTPHIQGKLKFALLTLTRQSNLERTLPIRKG